MYRIHCKETWICWGRGYGESREQGCIQGFILCLFFGYLFTCTPMSSKVCACPREYHGKKSSQVVGEAETRNSEWEQGKVSLILAPLFHIEPHRRGGWPDLDSSKVFPNSPSVLGEAGRKIQGFLFCTIMQSIGRREPWVTQPGSDTKLVLYASIWDMWSLPPWEKEQSRPGGEMRYASRAFLAPWNDYFLHAETIRLWLEYPSSSY